MSETMKTKRVVHTCDDMSTITLHVDESTSTVLVACCDPDGEPAAVKLSLAELAALVASA